MGPPTAGTTGAPGAPAGVAAAAGAGAPAPAPGTPGVVPAPAHGVATAASAPAPSAETCLVVLPMSDEARAAGIRRLVHHPVALPLPPATPPSAGQLPGGQRTIEVPVGRPAKLPGLAAWPSASSNLLETTWIVDLGLGTAPTPDALPGWVRASGPRGRAVELTAPAEADGAAVAVSGRDRARRPTFRLLLFGERARAHYDLYRRAYLATRVADGRLPPLGPDQQVAQTVLELAGLLVDDVDGDGTPELVVMVAGTYRDRDRNTLAIVGELGVLWPGQPGRVASTFVPLDEGLVFPSLEIVPPRLNGGRPLLFHASGCCDGLSARSWHLTPAGRLEAGDRLQGDGHAASRRVCLQPSASGAAHLRQLD